MVDPRIQWPISIVARNDPTLSWIAPNAKELAMYMEYWNSESEVYNEDWVVKDAMGRSVWGIVEHLNLVKLILQEDARTEES